jgi:hypothetical protein
LRKEGRVEHSIKQPLMRKAVKSGDASQATQLQYLYGEVANNFFQGCKDIIYIN